MRPFLIDLIYLIFKDAGFRRRVGITIKGCERYLKVSGKVVNSTDTAGYFTRESAGWSGKYEVSRHFSTRLRTVMGWISSAMAPGARLLDYGCGSGVLMRELLRAGYQVTGVDIAPGMVEAARQMLRALEAEGVSGISGSVELIEAPDFAGKYQEDAYDAVVSLGVLEYVEDLDTYFRRLVSCLAPGGRLILSAPNQVSFLRGIERFIFDNPNLFKKLGLFPQLTGPDSYLHFQRHQLTLAGLDVQLAEYGLVRQQAFYHVAPEPLKKLESSPVVAMTFIAEYRKPV